MGGSCREGRGKKGTEGIGVMDSGFAAGVTPPNDTRRFVVSNVQPKLRIRPRRVPPLFHLMCTDVNGRFPHGCIALRCADRPLAAVLCEPPPFGPAHSGGPFA